MKNYTITFKFGNCFPGSYHKKGYVAFVGFYLNGEICAWIRLGKKVFFLNPKFPTISSWVKFHLNDA